MDANLNKIFFEKRTIDVSRRAESEYAHCFRSELQKKLN
jgi:hypothetical protein